VVAEVTVLELVQDLKAERAAQRQYRAAAERMGERSIRELHARHPILAVGMAAYANRILLMARGELDCE